MVNYETSFSKKLYLWRRYSMLCDVLREQLKGEHDSSRPTTDVTGWAIRFACSLQAIDELVMSCCRLNFEVNDNG